MRKLFRKWASYFVTSYAKKIFKQAVDAANYKSQKLGQPVYVISHPFDDRKLIVITADEFVKLREQYRVTYLKMRTKDMIRDCWYRTEDPFPMSDQYVRQLAFIRLLLKKAKLC